MITILIVDDQAVVRAGLRTILELHDELQVVGEAADGHGCLVLVERLDPDVVLMDIRMPGLDGIQTTRRLTATGRRARVCMLTTYGIDEHVYDALQAGAAGFLVKTDAPDRIVHAVRAIAGGDTVLGPDTTARLVELFLARTPRQPSTTRPDPGLTDRETDVLHLLATGLSNAEIARRLTIGEGTVKTHVAHILTKLGVRDRVQAAVYAHQHGLFPANNAMRPGKSSE